LSTTATTLSTIGRMQTDETTLRLLLLASTPFWAAHDLIVGSLPGLIADVLSMATGAIMLLRRAPAIHVVVLDAIAPLGLLLVSRRSVQAYNRKMNAARAGSKHSAKAKGTIQS
jgi:Bacterial inner membrane protein